MMIKLNAGSGEWAIFDQCRNVTYDKTWVTIPVGVSIEDTIRNVKGWEVQTGHVYHNLITVDGPGDSSEVEGLVMRWDSVDGSHMLFTNSSNVYLMSDDGETIERI